MRDNAPLTPTPTDEDYRRLLELRTGLRRFLRWSESQAEAAGLTPAQHQLLLAIRGHPDPAGRPSAMSPTACCYVITARSAWSTARPPRASSSAGRTPTASASCGCT